MTMMGLGGVDLFLASLAMLVDVVLLKGTLLVCIGVGVSYLLRGSSAARRHGVWAAVVLGLLITPLLRTIAPTWTGATMVEMRAPDVVTPAPPPAALHIPLASDLARTPQLEVPLEVPLEVDGRTKPTTYYVGAWSRGIVLTWFVGAALMLGLFAIGLVRAVRLRARATAAPQVVQDRATAGAAKLGFARVPAVLWSHEVEVPGALGLFRACVVLPADVLDWPPERLDAVLLHELSHIRRRDWAMHLVASMVRAVYWVNPVVWMAERRLAHERELACDDRAIGDRSHAVQYAEQLVHFARALRGPVTASAALNLLGRSSLASRVRSILDDARSRAPLPRTWTIGAAALTAAVIVPLAGVEILAVVHGPALVQPRFGGVQESEALVRRRHAWTLGELESVSGVAPAAHALRDPDPRVRMMAAWALGEIKDWDAGPALVAALGDEDPGVREMVVLALGELQDPSLADAILTARSDALLEAPAAWALAEMRGADSPPVWAGRLRGGAARTGQTRLYLAELSDGSGETRARAAEKLGRVGDPIAVEPLMDALRDPEPAVRAMAVWALDEINPTRSDSPARKP